MTRSFRTVVSILAVVAVAGAVVHHRAMEFRLGHSRVPVTKERLENTYPVIVVTRDGKGQYEACWRDYSYLKDSGSDYGFTIPKEAEREIREQLAEPPTGHCVGVGESTFSVERHGDGTQSIIAFCGGHDDMNCYGVWYTAGRHGVVPHYASTFALMPVILFEVLPAEVGMAVLLWALSKVSLAAGRNGRRFWQ